MKKQGPKNRHYGKGAQGSKKQKGEWKVRNIPQEHEEFRDYYISQLNLEEEDFKQFWASMKEKLPIVFRVNPNCPRYEAFCQKIQSDQFIKSLIPVEVKKQIEEGNESNVQEAVELKLLKWYPGDILFSMNTTKNTLKKDKIFSEFHKYLQKVFDSGLISRQELVSMLPPLYLNAGPDDIVLDMCAAPGSKTSQILEMMYGDRRRLTKGCVVANDADYSRAQMLIHQLQRSGTAGMVVINHPGQFMPQLSVKRLEEKKEKFQFDKILCDVPCSGDGATRKIPLKWANWHTNDGMVLHPLQLSILVKAINLLKPNGQLVYSTCSLNPIENQAVINGLFQKVQTGLELIDIHPLFEVKGRRGMLTWKILTIEHRKPEELEGENKPSKRYLKEHKTYQQCENLTRIKQSMFPPASIQEAAEIGLQKTMRILPHDQNSGGFYVALLRKLPNFKWKSQKKQEEQLNPDLENIIAYEQNKQEENFNQKFQQKHQDDNNSEEAENQIIIQKKQQRLSEDKKAPKKGDNKYERYQNISEEEFENIERFYGFSKQFRCYLYVRENANLKKKVILLSEGVRRFLEADPSNKINLVNMGVQAFEKGKESFSGNQCLYKLCQQGIYFLLDHMTLRKIKVPLIFFKTLIEKSSIPHEQVNEEIRNQMRKMGQGTYCLYINEEIEGRKVVDVIVGQNYQLSFHNMITKEDKASLLARYA